MLGYAGYVQLPVDYSSLAMPRISGKFLVKGFLFLEWGIYYRNAMIPLNHKINKNIKNDNLSPFSIATWRQQHS